MRIYEPRAYTNAPIANSYWATTTDQIHCDPLEGALTCDTVVIGAGYTGLHAALELTNAGQKVVILEEHQPGWGASGRNGGFCCLGGAKASPQKLTKTFGEDATNEYLRAEVNAVDYVAGFLSRHKIQGC